jgi:PAS domain S-box-containing protein
LADLGADVSGRLANDSLLQTFEGPRGFWEAVVDLFTDAVFLVGPDRRILYWNRAAEALTGYARAEAVGHPCLTAVHCEACEGCCGVFEYGHVRDVPLTLRRRDGTRVEVLKSATVVHSPSGAPTLGIEVLRDMTVWNERERSYRASQLAAEEQQILLRGVLDSVTEGIVGVGADGAVRFVSASAQGLLGVTEEEVVGRPVAALVGADVARHATHVLESGGAVNSTRVDVSTPAGATLPATVAVSPMHLADSPEGALILLHDMREEERGMRERLRSGDFAYGALISRSPRMREVFDLIDHVAPTTATILIQGESGTGKELVAREVHRRSRRAGGPFHAVNCAALASEILESEFFGHERGAFTGAVLTKKGRFEVAHTGTIFLDEVGELRFDLQAKLLRVLEERAFERVGGTETIRVDVRVVAATNRDLMAMVRAGAFREDLFYRLRVVPLPLPPLRERVEDIEPLAEHHLRRIAEREGTEALHLTAGARRLLMEHRWPGNVRELANAMEYAAAVADGDTIRDQDLPRELREPGQAQPTPSASAPPASLRESNAASQPPLIALPDERSRIEAALAQTRWAHAEAAQLLGMHRTTLYRKRLLHGL